MTWFVEVNVIQESTAGVQVTVAVVARCSCSELVLRGHYQKKPHLCPSTATLTINGRPVCDSHVARALRQLAAPIDYTI